MTSPTRNRNSSLAAIAVVLGATATASNPVFVRLADVELVASAFHRMLWAIPIFGLWSLAARRGSMRQARISKREILLVFLCGSFFAADLVSLHVSISLTHAANSILFLNAQPIYVVVIGWLVFGTLVTRRYVVAALVAMTGAVMLVWQSADFGGDHLVGDGLAVVAGLCYAGFIISAARLRNGRSSAEINLWTCIVGAPVLLMVALVSGQDIVPDTARDWGMMVALGVISQATGQGLIVWGLGYLPASFSAVVLLLAPIAAAVFAWLILGESLTVLQCVAIGVVLCGVYGAWRASFVVVEQVKEGVRPG